MAIHYLNGSSYKNNTPVAPDKYKKAVEAAKTYDWHEKEMKSSHDNYIDDDGNKKERPEYPKTYECKRTKIIAVKNSKNDPVMFVDGKLLTLTVDDQDVKDIIL